MNAEKYRQHIMTARSIVENSDLTWNGYKEAAFAVILEHLIDTDYGKPSVEFEQAVEAAVEKRLEDARDSRKDRD